ncbi:MAG: tetratricopeptide repeat protein [Anaerolineales bacterium]|nr:tetratricopeptide repeat protein [Anaerolineales bacterium]
MSAETEPERRDLFKNSVIVMLTLVSVFAALVTFLQNYASLSSSDLAQRSSFSAVDATGLYFRSGLTAAQGTDVLQRYQEFVQRSVRADTKARALRMGGEAALAAEYDLEADRWRQAADRVATSDPLLAEFGQDLAWYNEELSRDAYREEEKEHTLLEQSRVWSSKANGYVAVLSSLSVALFLAGLSLTLSSRLRYLLALSALGLTLACGAWVLAILFSPVPVVPDEAIERFVEGRIQYTLATSRGEDGSGSLDAFDAALELAPNYGRALFYRSLANTDSTLLAKHLDTQQAIDDARRAIELGNHTSPVYGNLGWLYYLNGQYRSALEHTERALEMSGDDCYLAFNHGLIRLALSQPEAARDAYTVAIDCAQRESSDAVFNYYMDVGVTDLVELAAARPDLGDTLNPAIERLKEALAQVRLYGMLQDAEVEAKFGSISFGGAVDSGDIVQDLASEFPQSATIVYAQLTFENVKPESRWLTRWVLDGEEYLSRAYDSWIYGESGTTWISLYNYGGLTSGTYTLDVFVEGQLVTSGQVTVLPGDLPPMTYFSSTGVGVTISYPTTWNVTDLADNEVSVVAARNPASADFFGVTAWVASTGTDEDVFQLFDLYLDALEQDREGFSAEAREAFTLAERDGWLNYYEYTNASGELIQGALSGVVDADSLLTYIVVIEARDAEWDEQVEMFNVMLERMTIDQ